MKHLDLFSGIGGFALAARWCGIETVAFCEIEPYACKVLNKNFPNIPIHNDVRRTDEFIQYKNQIDIITGGYPCQEFSLAGKRKGEKGHRYLWPAMFEVVKLTRPAWIIAENVYGHVTLGLDKVLSDLETSSYSARAIIVPASAKGALHRRDRVWIIANDNRQRGQGSREKKVQRKRRIQGCENVRGFKEFIPRPNIHSPKLCRRANGISERLDSLGNAIVPQVAYEIMQAILKHHES